MKKFFSLIVAILFAGSMMAEDSVVYTLDPVAGSNNGYANNCDIVVDDITWNLTGNAQMVPWRIGGKSLTGVNRELYSKTAIESNVTKIEIAHGAAQGITVNSFTIIVTSDAAFTDTISVLTPTFAAYDTLTVERPNGADWSNAYYKFVYNVTVSGSSNKFLQFNFAKFYASPYPIGGNWSEIVFVTTSAAGELDGTTFSSMDGTLKLDVVDTNDRMSVDKNTQRFGTPADSTSYYYRLKTATKSSDANAMTLNVPAAGWIRIAVRTGSSDAKDRHILLTQDSKSLYYDLVVEDDSINVDGKRYYNYIYAEVKAGKVIIEYPDGGLYFYAFGFQKTTAAPVYYLVGDFNNWERIDAYKMKANPAVGGEYMLDITLIEGSQEMKVQDNDGVWYPGGENNNFLIYDTGDYTIYFRPDGQGDQNQGWHLGYIYAEYHAPYVKKDLYEVAEIIKDATAGDIVDNDSIAVRGVITKMEMKGKNFYQYGSVNIYVADATGAEGQFEFYNCYSLAADTFATTNPAYDATSNNFTQVTEVTDRNGLTIHVGDTVIAKGKYMYYSTSKMHELQQGCYLVYAKAQGALYPTAIENAATEQKAIKIVRDGQFFIKKGNKTYNVMGAVVR